MKQIRQVFDEMEDLMTGDEIDTGCGNLTPALRGQHCDRWRELSKTEPRSLTGDGRWFYSDNSLRMQERNETLEQATMMAAYIKDALDRPARLCLNMPDQARPEDMIRMLKRGIIFEWRQRGHGDTSRHII
jgi:hypothetical protein